MPLPQILLIEDDRNISHALAQALGHDYDVDQAPTGRQAIYMAERNEYNLIILDLNLPDTPGLTVCQQLRESGYKSPILILSGEDNVINKIKLLDAGANDYLTKPFSLGELKARLRSIARQVNLPAIAAADQIYAYNILLDRPTQTVRREGQIIKLRRKEFAILECLMNHAGTAVTRKTLANFAWQGNEKLWTNTLDVHIRQLRNKFDKPFDTKLIVTIHGVGYKLVSPLNHRLKNDIEP